MKKSILVLTIFIVFEVLTQVITANPGFSIGGGGVRVGGSGRGSFSRQSSRSYRSAPSRRSASYRRKQTSRQGGRLSRRTPSRRSGLARRRSGRPPSESNLGLGSRQRTSDVFFNKESAPTDKTTNSQQQPQMQGTEQGKYPGALSGGIYPPYGGIPIGLPQMYNPSSVQPQWPASTPLQTGFPTMQRPPELELPMPLQGATPEEVMKSDVAQMSKTLKEIYAKEPDFKSALYAFAALKPKTYAQIITSPVLRKILYSSIQDKDFRKDFTNKILEEKAKKDLVDLIFSDGQK